MNDFQIAMKHVLKWEGFISNDKNDKGGLTIWGISSRSHKDAVYEMKRLIEVGDKDEAYDIAEHIYWNVYWLKMDCDKKIFPANIIIFDTAINMGRSRAKEIYDKSTDWQDYLLLRLYTYSKFKQAKLYFRGWANRTLDLYKLIRKETKGRGDN